jgi:hypothetical protein
MKININRSSSRSWYRYMYMKGKERKVKEIQGKERQDSAWQGKS